MSTVALFIIILFLVTPITSATNSSALCPPISVTGQCGPEHGRCPGPSYASWAIYCNPNTNWCGDTNAHRDATPDDNYDWISSQCQSTPNTIISFGFKTPTTNDGYYGISSSTITMTLYLSLIHI